MQGKWLRWHRFSSEGTKEIRCFLIKDPLPPTPEGYTEWRRGSGPMGPAARARVTEGIRRICLGVPKRAEHKEKMRLAKLGKPKTEQHRQNMSLAQRARMARLRESRKQETTHAHTEDNT